MQQSIEPSQDAPAAPATDRPVVIPGQPTNQDSLATSFTAPNSFGALRLLFALTVLFSHGWALSGHVTPVLGQHEAAELAVDSFFVISGFLITRSGQRVGVLRYLWHRALRILPAFWACLMVTAFVIAPLAWLHRTGSLHGYLTASPHGPVRYVLDNALVWMRYYDIAGTPTGTFFPRPGTAVPISWDASLWTLWWELLCYLGVAALAAVGLLRRRAVLAIAAILLALSTVYSVGADRLPHIPAFQRGISRFGLYFLAGAVLCLHADRIPCSGRLAGASALAVFASFFMSAQDLVCALPLAYLCVWLGIRLPLRRIGTRHDMSYGVYIFGFPIQQLAVIYGLHRLGAVAYLAATSAVTALLAAASAVAVEEPALRHKNARPPWRRDRQSVSGPASPAIPRQTATEAEAAQRARDVTAPHDETQDH
jgi:peptidoglycan/LPS O-acetylase OafA/YrhL